MRKFILIWVAIIASLLLLSSCGGEVPSTSTMSEPNSSEDSITIDSSKPDSTETDSSITSDSTDESGACVAHQYTEWEIVEAPSCTNEGLSERVCTRCGEQETRKEPIGEHLTVIDPRVEPTCGKAGFAEGSHCGECGEVLVRRKVIPATQDHKEYEFVKYIKEPTFNGSGSAEFACTECKKTKTESLSTLVEATLSKSDIFNVTVSENNPAEDNKWYIFDGNCETVGIYNPGKEWFGNVGDVLTVTLSQEILLTDLYMYTAGNWTIASVTVRDSYGNITLEKAEVIANAFSFGGEGEHHNVFTDKLAKAYTIEIEIKSNKDNHMGFKLTELIITGAKTDTRLPHRHDYREYLSDVSAATCTAEGKVAYSCYCGGMTEITTPKTPHNYDSLLSSVKVSCETDGVDVFACSCGETKTVVTPHKGHIYARLKEYIKEPTFAEGGEAVYLCIGCQSPETRALAPLTLEEIQYLRIDRIDDNFVRIKFNIYSSPVLYDIRYSDKTIDGNSFNQATKVNVTVTGKGEMSAEIPLDTVNKSYYIAVRPYAGDNYGKIATVRVGGNGVIPVDYNSAKVYHGETQSSLVPLFDEQGEEFLIGTKKPSSTLGRIFNDSGDSILYGSLISPIVDLEYMHYVSCVYLYYAKSGINVKVRWSSTPVDFQTQDNAWDGVYSTSVKSGWNEIPVYCEARYVQIIFEDGQAPAEMMLRGYQCGEGSQISTEKREFPTLGEMMGMCGFVAAGDGNTPVDSVLCAPIMREYHHFEWTYKLNAYPNKGNFFDGWMGNFDSAYRQYTAAGIEVIPCFQWNVKNVVVAHKVDSNNMPVKNGSSFERASFWEKFNPHTYFQYANAMFGFSARYGTNTSANLLSIIEKQTQGTGRVGYGYIKWMELGNEPDGDWNGIHNYLSAYQLAAFTSAGYDGHCRTLKPYNATDGYYFGVKNADPNMKVAMAGLAGIKNEYIGAMLYWMEANRSDGKIALDAFNVHHYMNKEITLPSGIKVTVGISPEEGDLVGKLSALVELRDKYYPDKEVWITEFGWDTNQSYGTVNSAHAYGEYTGRQVQAMWLTRTYLLLSASGVDKAIMYMCEDTGTVEEEAVGKFATSGVIGFAYDERGNKIEVKKDSYYYLYTLNNTLREYSFSEKIEAYDENVMIYEYTTSNGKTAYALWCPTSDGTKSEGYKLKIDGTKATLIEAVYGDTDGVQTDLTPDSLGYVTVNASENPIYVVVD